MPPNRQFKLLGQFLLDGFQTGFATGDSSVSVTLNFPVQIICYGWSGSEPLLSYSQTALHQHKYCFNNTTHPVTNVLFWAEVNAILLWKPFPALRRFDHFFPLAVGDWHFSRVRYFKFWTPMFFPHSSWYLQKYPAGYACHTQFIPIAQFQKSQIFLKGLFSLHCIQHTQSLSLWK